MGLFFLHKKRHGAYISTMKILSNVPLKDKTTFKCGGTAKWYAEPADFLEFATLLKLHKGKLFVLGGGSKTICSDKGFDGLVISTQNLSKICFDGDLVVCDAGVKFENLRGFCIKNALSGLEWSAGIPASVGGASVMNAGAFGHDFAESVEKVEIFENGKTRILEKKDISFSYRNSSLKNKIVFRVWLRLKKSSRQEVEEEFLKFAEQKQKNQPVCMGSAGSIFKRQENVIPAKIIDKLGLKGVKIGGAEVSTHHSGFIVNTGSATASDVLSLVELIRKTVQKKTGVVFENELIVLE